MPTTDRVAFGDGLSPSRTYRPAGEPLGVGHDELRDAKRARRCADRRRRGVPDHGSRPRAGTQLLRHRRRLRRRAWSHRVDRRAVVRPGRSTPRAGGAGHQGLQHAQPVAERRTPLGAAHPAGVRGQPAPPADRPHRPLPDAPRRPRHAVGGDLAGDGPARRAGQGPLRRQQQLRRVAHRQGERGGGETRIARSGVGAEPLQPQCPDGRARSASCVRRLWRGRHPVEPARRRVARRRARRPRDGWSTWW